MGIGAQQRALGAPLAVIGTDLRTRQHTAYTFRQSVPMRRFNAIVSVYVFAEVEAGHARYVMRRQWHREDRYFATGVAGELALALELRRSRQDGGALLTLNASDGEVIAALDALPSSQWSRNVFTPHP